jgi:opacity protein-like surface antigen
MRRACGQGILVCLLVAGLAWPAVAWGANFDYSRFRGEFGLRFAYGKTTKKADVRLFSLLPRWGIYLLRPGNAWVPGLGVSFVAEGIISLASAEDTGFELGITPLLKISYPLFRNILLFVEGGAGLITESINSPALAHAFNFTPQVGAGLDIALTPRLAATLAYRFRHSSNAGIYRENPAFNVNFIHAGLTYYY